VIIESAKRILTTRPNFHDSNLSITGFNNIENRAAKAMGININLP
jgi:hypothetical protein